MLVIGLTGGIASGVSTVSRILEGFGAQVINSDLVARDVIAPGGQAWPELVAEFGRSILRRDGTIDRRRLGQAVFGRPERVRRLNEITHPRILATIRERVEAARRLGGDRVLVVDAPLLLEVGLETLVDRVWVVTVDHQTQVARLMARDRFSLREALDRISAQLPLEEKVRRADAVIDNRGGAEDTRRQVLSLWRALWPQAGGGAGGDFGGGGTGGSGGGQAAKGGRGTGAGGGA